MNMRKWIQLGPALPVLLSSFGCAMNVDSFEPGDDVATTEQALEPFGFDPGQASAGYDSNIKNLATDVSVRLPDFSIERIEPAGCNDHWPGVAVTIANHGQSSGRIWVEVFVAGSPPPDYNLIGRRSPTHKLSPLLDAGESTTMTFDIRETLQDVRIYISAVLDANQYVLESDESNNVSTEEIVLPECRGARDYPAHDPEPAGGDSLSPLGSDPEGAGAGDDPNLDNLRADLSPLFEGALPDLSVVRIEPGDCTYDEDGSGRPGISVTFANHGARTARTWVDLFFKRSTPPPIGSRSRKFGLSPLLDEGETSTMTFYLGKDYDNRRYHASVLLDTNQYVSESDETNNAGTGVMIIPECPSIADYPPHDP